MAFHTQLVLPVDMIYLNVTRCEDHMLYETLVEGITVIVYNFWGNEWPAWRRMKTLLE